jgi:hypothetical protein
VLCLPCANDEQPVAADEKQDAPLLLSTDPMSPATTDASSPPAVTDAKEAAHPVPPSAQPAANSSVAVPMQPVAVSSEKGALDMSRHFKPVSIPTYCCQSGSASHSLVWLCVSGSGIEHANARRFHERSGHFGEAEEAKLLSVYHPCGLCFEDRSLAPNSSLLTRACTNRWFYFSALIWHQLPAPPTKFAWLASCRMTKRRRALTRATRRTTCRR